MVLGIPLPVIFFLITAIALGFILGATIYGRQIYQVGTNNTAALHAGIKSNRIKFGLFILLGVVSAACGIMAASRLGSVRYDLALGGELQMVLMAMLGGTYIFGGRGTTWNIFSRLALGYCFNWNDSSKLIAGYSAYRTGLIFNCSYNSY